MLPSISSFFLLLLFFVFAWENKKIFLCVTLLQNYRVRWSAGFDDEFHCWIHHASSFMLFYQQSAARQFICYVVSFALAKFVLLTCSVLMRCPPSLQQHAGKWLALVTHICRTSAPTWRPSSWTVDSRARRCTSRRPCTWTNSRPDTASCIWKIRQWCHARAFHFLGGGRKWTPLPTEDAMLPTLIQYPVSFSLTKLQLANSRETLQRPRKRCEALGDGVRRGEGAREGSNTRVGEVQQWRMQLVGSSQQQGSALQCTDGRRDTECIAGRDYPPDGCTENFSDCEHFPPKYQQVR